MAIKETTSNSSLKKMEKKEKDKDKEKKEKKKRKTKTKGNFIFSRFSFKILRFRKKNQTVPMDVTVEEEVVVATPKNCFENFQKAKVIENNIKQEVIAKASSKNDDIELVEHDSLDRTDQTSGYPSSPELFWNISCHKSRTKKCNACKLESWSVLPVIMVTLMLIMFLSRAWAIVCLSLWFYVLARLRGEKTLQYVEEEDINKMDMDIVEYKKKVILQGLLRRSKPKAMATTTRQP